MKRGYRDAELGSPSASGSRLLDGDAMIKGKSRACSECKKHKIKCLTEPGQQKCRRCARQDLSCVTDNTLQKFVDDDSRWKAESTLRTSRLEHAVQDILRNLHLLDLQSYDTEPTSVDHASQPHRPLPLEVQSSVVTRENSREPALDGHLCPYGRSL